MDTSTAPAKILLGISLDAQDSKELLSWAISILSHPNDTIVALHVLVGEEPKRLMPRTRHNKRFGQAKSFVLSVTAEFARTCHSKQVHLEARVKYSSSVQEGLLDEARRIRAEFLVLGGSKTASNKFNGDSNGGVSKYCFKQAPKGCSVVSIGNSSWSNAHFHSNSFLSQGSPTQKENKKEGKQEKGSPRTVLRGIEDGSSSGNSTTSDPPPQPKPKSKLSRLKHVASIFNRSRRRETNIIVNQEKHQPLLRCFSYDEISHATNDFHPDNMVGQGGYSEVYRGDLSDGTSIAVKRLANKENTNVVTEKDFLVELGISGQVCHPNTASLVGYCIDNGLYLVFPFSANGNLSTALHDNKDKTLGWRDRYEIAKGVARGLQYLHKGCKHRIIHRDIKSSNVLLGSHFEPQIADFGLARWVPNKMSGVVSIEGTFGYLAPEYVLHGLVDDKTDVFAFGILLLEILSGRRPVDSSKQHLLLWATPLLESGRITELVDPRLEGKYDKNEVNKVALTAAYCVQHSSLSRPSMSEVVELLTNGDENELVQNLRVPKISSNEINDYSMIFGYGTPIDIDLQKAVAELEI